METKRPTKKEIKAAIDVLARDFAADLVWHVTVVGRGAGVDAAVNMMTEVMKNDPITSDICIRTEHHIRKLLKKKK